MECLRCGSGATRRDGQTRLGGQRCRRGDCRRRFTARSASAFTQHGFADEVIALAVRWYVRYRLSYADVTEWLTERGLDVDRTTVYSRVRRFLPLLGEAARGCALVRNLRNGVSMLTARVPRALRLATAWPQLARAI